MYADTVTVYNRYESGLGNMWYPTVIPGADLNIDKAAILSKYGAESQNKAILHIRYEKTNGGIYVAGKKWLSPKDWDRQNNDLLTKTITFTSEATEADFFAVGDFGGIPVKDSDYNRYDGFYNYLKANRDYVFIITSVAMYSIIPHFEIMAR